jgi:hypothetical protein
MDTSLCDSESRRGSAGSQLRVVRSEKLRPGQFGNPEKRECPPLKLLTSSAVKTMTENTDLCVR